MSEDRVALARIELAKRELQRRSGGSELAVEGNIKPMFSSNEEAVAANEKQKRAQFEAQGKATPIGIAASAVSNTLDPFVNAAALGIPDIISKKISGKPAVSEDAQMKWLSEPVGILAGGLGKIGLSVANRIVPQGVKAGLGMRIAQGAGAGSTAGIQLQSDEQGNVDVGKQLTQSAIGAAGGAGLGIAASSVGAGNRIINSFKGPSSSDLEATLALRKAAIGVEKQKLTDLFTQKSKDITLKGKSIIPEISRGMSKAYEQGLDDIFSKLDDPIQAGSVLKKNAPAITNTELVDSLDGLVGKVANDPLVVKSNAYQQTVKMLNDFKEGTVSPAGLLDASGKKLSQSAPQAVDIKDLISRVREIKTTIKASTQSGNTPVTANDYFATQFDRTIGGLLKNRVEGFRELQASYAPMANTRRVAYKLFKPLADEDSASAFLNRIKNNTMKGSDEKLLKFIEDGGEVAGKKIPGMGAFSPELKNIGAKLKVLNSGNEQRKLAADMAQKAADEKFRNRFLLWTVGAATGSAGIKKGAEFLTSD